MKSNLPQKRTLSLNLRGVDDNSAGCPIKPVTKSIIASKGKARQINTRVSYEIEGKTFVMLPNNKKLVEEGTVIEEPDSPCGKI